MAYPYMQSKECLLCFPAQSQKHWGATWKLTVTTGELQRAREVQQPSSRTVIYSFVQSEPGRTLQDPTEWPPTSYLCAHFWQNCQNKTPWGWHKGLKSCSITCSHSSAQCSLIGFCQKTPKLAGPPLVTCSLHSRAQVQSEHIWHAWKNLWMLCCL